MQHLQQLNFRIFTHPEHRIRVRLKSEIHEIYMLKREIYRQTEQLNNISNLSAK